MVHVGTRRHCAARRAAGGSAASVSSVQPTLVGVPPRPTLLLQVGHSFITLNLCVQGMAPASSGFAAGLGSQVGRRARQFAALLAAPPLRVLPPPRCMALPPAWPPPAQMVGGAFWPTTTGEPRHLMAFWNTTIHLVSHACTPSSTAFSVASLHQVRGAAAGAVPCAAVWHIAGLGSSGAIAVAKTTPWLQPRPAAPHWPLALLPTAARRLPPRPRPGAGT